MLPPPFGATTGNKYQKFLLFPSLGLRLATNAVKYFLPLPGYVLGYKCHFIFRIRSYFIWISCMCIFRDPLSLWDTIYDILVTFWPTILANKAIHFHWILAHLAIPFLWKPWQIGLFFFLDSNIWPSVWTYVCCTNKHMVTL